ncbi:MAG: PQQ-binding-like beta-propeller repeat protein [Myxococcota bacterium]
MKTALTLAAWTALLSGCSLLRVAGVGVDHWKEGEAAYHRKKYDEAAEHYAAVKPDHAKYQRAQVGIGRCLWKQDKLDESVTQMLSARRIDAATFDGTKRLVTDLSLLYGAVAAETVAKTGDPIVAVHPQSDGSLLLMSDRGALSAADAQGNTRWETPLGGRHSGAKAQVAIDGDHAYSVSYDSQASKLLAIKIATGEQTWTHDLGKGWIWSTAAAANGTVYAPMYKHVVALNGTSGEVLWTTETSAKRPEQLLVAGDAVCAEIGEAVECWSAATGEAQGSYTMPQRTDHGGIVSDGSKLYVTADNALYAVELGGGMSLAWKQLIGERASAPTLAADKGLIAISTVKQLRLFDTATGKPAGEIDKPLVGTGTRIRPARRDGGWLVSSGRALYSLPDQGGWDWVASFTGTITSPPVPVGDKSVLVAASVDRVPAVLDVLGEPW